MVSEFESRFDAAGRKLATIEATGDRTTWTHDPTGQLLSEHRSGSNSYRHTFSYDPAGNRLVKNEDGDVTTYSYDSANRLVYSYDFLGRTTYSYDPDGNQRSILAPSFDITTYSYNSENRLIQAELADGEIVTHTYALVKRDGTVLRTSTDDGFATTRYLWDGDQLVTELDEYNTRTAHNTYEPQPQYAPLISRQESPWPCDDYGYGYGLYGGLYDPCGSSSSSASGSSESSSESCHASGSNFETLFYHY